jgi:hypothetical protein
MLASHGLACKTMALMVVDGIGIGIHMNVVATTRVFVRHVFLLYLLVV